MEYLTRITSMQIPSSATALDLDDLNGPGSCRFPKKTGDLSVDFALFKISVYASAGTLADRVKFTMQLGELAQQLGRGKAENLAPVLLNSAHDSPIIKAELAKQLPILAKIYTTELGLGDKLSE